MAGEVFGVGLRLAFGVEIKRFRVVAPLRLVEARTADVQVVHVVSVSSSIIRTPAAGLPEIHVYIAGQVTPASPSRCELMKLKASIYVAH